MGYDAFLLDDTQIRKYERGLSDERVYRAMVSGITKHEGYETVSSDVDVQYDYVMMRLRGESHNIAKMCALQSPPRVMTDDVFMSGSRGGNQFANNEFVGRYYHAKAKEHGVDPTGKVYKAGLAEFPGDPRAWVSSRAEMKDLITERGWSCDGAVSVKARPVDSDAAMPETYRVDSSLVASEVDRRISENPGDFERTPANRQDMIEQLTEMRSGYDAIGEPD